MIPISRIVLNSFTYNGYRHNITEIVLNVALNTIKQTNKINITLNGEITLVEITSAIRNLKTKWHSTWI
jgi:hypothetical protein